MLLGKDSNLCPDPTFMFLTLLHVEKRRIERKEKKEKKKEKKGKKRLPLLASIYSCCMCCSQDLMNRMGSGNLYSEGGFPDLDADVRSNYIMNTTLLGVEKADAILLIGSNPRIEAPVFNAR